MNRIKQLCVVVSLCFLAVVAAQAQTPAANYVYVATGGPNIYAVPASGATSALPGLIQSPNPNGSYSYNSSAAFDSLAVGPDNTGDNLSTPSVDNHFFLYACDSSNGTIVRLQLSVSQPDAQAAAVDLVSSAVPAPVCGRVDSEGDLYVSSKNPGSGVYVISGASTTAVNGSFHAATQLFSSSTGGSFTGGGIAQKNNGDMLVVDTAGDSILHGTFVGAGSGSSAAPFAPTLSDYGVTGLAAPSAIARISSNNFFVLNQGTKNDHSSNNVEEFDPADLSAGPTTCTASSGGGTNLSSLATSEDDFVYVGVNASSSNKQEIDVLSASNCSGAAVQTISLEYAGPPLGIAVPPVPASAPSTAGPPVTGYTSTEVNFGSSVVETLTSGCTPSISQSQASISYLQGLTNKATPGDGYTGDWTTGTPVPYNGEGGFGTVYTVSSSCDPADVVNNFIIGALTDTTQFTNPRIIRCDGSLKDSDLTCFVTEASGTWPAGGLVPDDVVVGGKIPGFSRFFLVNANLSGGNEAAQFCGFQSPLTNTTDPSQAATFSSGQNLSVKFKLATESGTCSGGPYVTDAQVLLSVQRISGGTGPAFQPINISTQGNSTDIPPVFKYNPNSQNYQFSLSLKGYTAGTYVITLTFLTNNTGFQSTLFNVQ